MFDKLVFNTLSNGVTKILSLLLNLLIVPVVVEKLGAESYGILVLGSSLLGQFAFLDFGYAKSVTRFVADYQARNNMDGVNRIINSSFIILFFVGLIISALLGVLLYFNLTDIFKISDSGSESFNDIVKALMVLSILYWPAKVFERALMGLHRFHLNNICDIPSKIISPLLVIFGAINNYSILEIFWLQQVGFIITWLMQIYFVYRIAGWRLKLKWDSETMKEIAGFSLWTFIASLSSVIMMQMDVILIGILLPVSSLALYNVFRILYMNIEKISDIAVSAITPYLVFKFVKGGEDEVRRHHVLGTKYSLTFIAMFTLLVILFAEPVLFHWMGKDYSQYFIMLQVIVGFGFLARINRFLPTTMTTLGKYKELAIIYLVAAILNVPLTIVLLQFFDSPGALLSTSLAGLLAVISHFIIIYPRHGLSIRDFMINGVWAATYPHIIIFTAVLILFSLLPVDFLFRSKLTFIGVAILVSVLHGLMILALVIERKHFWKVLSLFGVKRRGA